MADRFAGIEARVRAVIERSGMTHGSFAAAADMDATKLSKSLAGLRRFASLELALIAEAGDVTVDWLLTGRAQPAPVIAARVDDRTRTSLDGVVARAQDYDDVHEALERVGCGRAELPALPRANLDGRAVEQGTSLANAALRAIEDAGRLDDISGDLPAVAESVFGINVGIEALPGRPDGLSYCREGFRLALIDSEKSWTRQRYTLAHEIGHIIAGDAQDIQLDVDVQSVTTRRNVTEMRANAFAAALLMPADQVAVEFPDGVESIQFAKAVGTLGVSASALSWRLVNLNLIGQAERRELGAMSPWDAAERGGWRDRQLALVQRQTMTRVPSDLLDRGQRAYLAGKISARVLATILNITPEEFLEGATPADFGEPGDDEPAFAP